MKKISFHLVLFLRIILLSILLGCSNSVNVKLASKTNDKHNFSTKDDRIGRLIQLIDSTNKDNLESIDYKIYLYFKSYPNELIENYSYINNKLIKFAITLDDIICNEIFIQFEASQGNIVDKKAYLYLDSLFKNTSNKGEKIKERIKECLK